MGRDTVVRHHSWSEPGRIGQVQAFAPLLPPAEGRAEVDIKTFDDKAAREHLTAPGLAASAQTPWLPKEIAALVRPAALWFGLVAGLLCVAAGLYTVLVARSGSRAGCERGPSLHPEDRLRGLLLRRRDRSVGGDAVCA